MASEGIEDIKETAVDVVALCRLAGVGPRLFEVLLSRFGSLERIFTADASTLLALGGIPEETARKIAGQPSLREDARQYVRRLSSQKIDVVTRFDRSYPNLLFELNDPPPLLYVRGKMPDGNGKTVALVGAENATNEGIQLTVVLSRHFAQARVQVVASLAKGIDSAAHVGTKTAGGESYGILDSGFDHIHPAESMALVADVVESGGVITEYPPDQHFQEDNMESANRLIVGMAQAVVVSEVYRDSSRTLDVLKFCREIGKLAFLMVDPERGALTDEDSLRYAVNCGALPMVGLNKVIDITRTLV